MKIVIVIDEWGWAFEFFARGWKKYSKHDIDIQRYNGLTHCHVSSSDIVFAMSNIVRCRISKTSVPPEKLIVGIRSQYTHEMPVNMPCIAFVANCKAAYDKAIDSGIDESKMHYIKAAIDGEIFSYQDVSHNKTVGWAGNPAQKVKRTDLLSGIAKEYGGVKMKSDHGPGKFVPGKDRMEQVEWLRTLGCYVQTSSNEGLSQALMEAFACGIPVVATPAGDTGILVPEEWHIPISGSECIIEANRKIETLFNDTDFAREVGLSNRKKFEDEGWCWSKRVKEYDEFVEKFV
jgi:glycosyltransferase involved in cell wall biosynthesis